MNKALIVIPARGGSRGIPRKNLRPVAGLPLIVNAAYRCLGIEPEGWDIEAVVATDDMQIAEVCQAHGITVALRPTVDDDQPVHVAAEQVLQRIRDVGRIDPLEFQSLDNVNWDDPITPVENPYSVVGIHQCTSPLMYEGWLESAFDEFVNHEEELASAATVVPERHLLWGMDGPLYESRSNRQYGQTTVWRETGGLQLCRNFPRLEPEYGSPMIGIPHHLIEVPEAQALDIDTHNDLYIANRSIGKAQIGIVAEVGHRIGSGHLRRALTLADLMSHHDVVIGVRTIDEDKEFYHHMIADHGYPVMDETPLDDFDVVVFDGPFTTQAEVQALRSVGVLTVTFESALPAGSADLEFDALAAPEDGRLSGPEFFLPRSEFAGFDVERPRRGIVVTFGGTDPAGLSFPVAEAIQWQLEVQPWLEHPVTLVTPPIGESDIPVDNFRVVHHPASMAALMASAALVVTSQGRTVYEAALCGAPVLSIAVNARERAHYQLPGVVYMGAVEQYSLDPARVATTVSGLLSRPEVEMLDRAIRTRWLP
jgi:spore coat polysaccharide biosynthesis predicted glycosyltransferase SpsG/CMP-N-acetylneuraminic acid synthetase